MCVCVCAHVHSELTLMPTCIGDNPWKGTLLVDTSHKIMAKLYMSLALLSISSGLCPSTKQQQMNDNNKVCFIHNGGLVGGGLVGGGGG